VARTCAERDHTDFFSHQDDSTLGCGGLIARRLARNETIYVAYITDGAASHPGHPVFSPDMIASMRANEARIAAGILGIPTTNLFFLKAPDGRLPHLVDSERVTLVAQIRALITRIAPHEVFCTSRHDGSTEHVAAYALLREALNNFGEVRPRLVEYIVWSRWNPRWLRPALRASSIVHRQVLSPSESKLKRDAVDAYRSQVAPLPPWPEPVSPPYFTRVFNYPEEYFFIFKN